MGVLLPSLQAVKEKIDTTLSNTEYKKNLFIFYLKMFIHKYSLFYRKSVSLFYNV